ncbi:hypothetical protein BS78_08G147100 [Paspalum vaginatum]|nr:hypothetical protein BS78_08G147100 [Paspalum vaginatum]
MGVSSAMDWWDEWKLRVLVLCSLFVQFFLSFSQHIRRLYILRRMRVVVWIAYMGGDALAIYALATLFNRQKQHQTTTTTNALQVIWAPVLLIHLGGHWNISAYSLEDNELWRRHVVTLVSQVTVALYVFCKWWSGETRLLQAAVLLFVVGIIRFSEKPWALRKASFRTLVASTAKSSSSSPPRSDEASIHCVMVLCARRKKKKKEPSVLMKLAAAFTFSSCLRHVPAAQRISALVRQHAQDGWNRYIRDPATYRRFSNLRGELALSKKARLLEQLGWSFSLPFDELVLVWHVATDLCIVHHAAETSSSRQSAIASRTRSINCDRISNYMIHLLLVRPEMLLLGAREGLFMAACDEIDKLVMAQEDEPPPSSFMGIALRILLMEQQADQEDFRKKAPMISSALRLKKALTDHLGDADERWEVIQGVWVEMLCYSASRCRGYEHAKSLAYGGEFLTNVWLLWSSMGMETLPDMMQNPGPPEWFHPTDDEEQANAAASV